MHRKLIVSKAIFKPFDEEPFAPNNPKGYIGKLGNPGFRYILLLPTFEFELEQESFQESLLLERSSRTYWVNLQQKFKIILPR